MSRLNVLRAFHPPPLCRPLSSTPRLAASVSSGQSEILQATQQQHAGPSRTPVQARRAQHASPQDRRSAIQDERERKLKEYERVLKAKAAAEGLSSVEELAAKRRAEKDASLGATLGLKPTKTAATTLEQKDMELAESIRRRAEAEAKRKLESGELSSNPNGEKSPVKPLSSIMALDKLQDESAEKIKELWTGYHTLKNKLSAAIPVDVYTRLVAKARQYPQFVLPLPRTITSDADESIQPGETKQGYEMQFMEWGFLPSASSKHLPTTVLFTPLAEYKLRQEFAQPLLVLTHYTDLAESKGLVLMRGEITSNEELEATPTGIAAAEKAKSQGASVEEQERLKAPVQSTSGGRMSEQDAQLLAMTMQRFYLPNSGGEGNALKREELLKSFHEDPEKFRVDVLCDVAFAL